MHCICCLMENSTRIIVATKLKHHQGPNFAQILKSESVLVSASDYKIGSGRFGIGIKKRSYTIFGCF